MEKGKDRGSLRFRATPPTMTLRRRIHYYQRIFAAYLTGSTSQLTFWHDLPEANDRAVTDAIGEYYMTFYRKADYQGPFDANGVPMLDYRGTLGRQYNPIAVAQYALGNYNLWKKTGDDQRWLQFLKMAGWLVANLENNVHGIPVWMHHFDWDYRDTLKNPWYSGLAQGQGISVLARAFHETGDNKFLDCAWAAYRSFKKELFEGGVRFTDVQGDIWIEEYVVDPPTHILNGFIWGLWGIYDLALVTGERDVLALFDTSARTISRNLHRYDKGFWSLYDLSGKALPMIASDFYHGLHVTQLKIMHKLTGERTFLDYAARWEAYRQSRWNRKRAFALKALFKLCYY